MDCVNIVSKPVVRPKHLFWAVDFSDFCTKPAPFAGKEGGALHEEAMGGVERKRWGKEGLHFSSIFRG